MSFRRWQELVVTELAPTHHIKEKSQAWLTTHRFTVTLFFRSFLPDTSIELGEKTNKQEKRENIIKSHDRITLIFK